MQYRCHKCGEMIEEGLRACPFCGAPQIRVPQAAVVPASEIPPPPPPPTDAPAAEGESQPEAFSWPDAIPSAAAAGAAGALLSLLPFVSLGFPLWFFGTGVLAVHFYRSRRKLQPLSGGVGARLGALAAGVGFAIFSLLFSVEVAFVARLGLRQQMHDRVMHLLEQNPDPEMQRMVEWMMTPAGMAALVTFALAFLFLVYLVLSTLGGGLWAVRSKRGQGKS